MAGEDPGYLRWVRSLPCAVFGCTVSEVTAHHHTAGSTEPFGAGGEFHRRGKSQKAHDTWAIPMCHEHHMQLHSLSGWFRGWTGEQLRLWQTGEVERLWLERHGEAF